MAAGGTATCGDTADLTPHFADGEQLLEKGKGAFGKTKAPRSPPGDKGKWGCRPRWLWGLEAWGHIVTP